jgi:hypothetical protein
MDVVRDLMIHDIGIVQHLPSGSRWMRSGCRFDDKVDIANARLFPGARREPHRLRVSPTPIESCALPGGGYFSIDFWSRRW